MSVWDLNSGVSFTDNSTTDLTSTTSDFVWAVTNSSNIIYLKAVVSGSGGGAVSTFNTKVSVRIIS